MNVKQIIGLIILIAGIVLVIFTNYQKGRVASAKETVNTGKGFLPKNPIGGAVGGMMDQKVGQYDQPLMWCMVGGVVLIVVGASMVIFCRHRHK